jgi:hypothetical protein
VEPPQEKNGNEKKENARRTMNGIAGVKKVLASAQTGAIASSDCDPCLAFRKIWVS